MNNNNNTITCPFCERNHSVLRKDGKLRQTIHCKCRSKKYKYHTVISWCAGIGYQILDDDMRLIDVM